MYECFHCGEKAVIWDCDFTFEDYGDFNGDGIYQECHCTNCGAEITYRVPFKNNEDDETEEQGENKEDLQQAWRMVQQNIPSVSDT